MKLRLPFFLLLVVSLLAFSIANAQQSPSRLLIPSGGDYSDAALAALARAALARGGQAPASILVLPVGPLSDAPDGAFVYQDALKAAELLRVRLEEACKQVAAAGQVCPVTALSPLLTRTDVENPQTLRLLSGSPAAILILAANPAAAMQLIQNSPTENALAEAYQRGTIIAGDGAGAVMLSASMLAGDTPSSIPLPDLSFGVPDLWTLPERHGLLFGVQNAIFEQRLYTADNFGRMLNAISLPHSPHVAIGLDAGTGLAILDENQLQSAFGPSPVTILDAETYHAADMVQYLGPRYTISLRNVLVHLLSSGDASYDLAARRSSLAAPAGRIERSYERLALPSGAGALFLAGGLQPPLDGNPILSRFVNLCGGAKASLMIIALGYPTPDAAIQDAASYRAALGVPTQTLIIPADAAALPALPEALTCMVLIGHDQAAIQPGLLAPVGERWRSGVALLADDAAAVVLGSYYAAHRPIPKDRLAAQDAVQKTFQQGAAILLPGLGLVDVQIEPQMLAGRRWGRLFSLAFNHPDVLALGISENTALEIGPRRSVVWGENGLFVLDFSQATLATGDRQGFIVANGLLDLFAAGELIGPEIADESAAPIHVATPAIAGRNTLPPTAVLLPAATATPRPTATLIPTVNMPGRGPATRAPRPTQLPLATPPSTEHSVLDLMIVCAGIAVLVVLLGIWINRRRGDLR